MGQNQTRLKTDSNLGTLEEGRMLRGVSVTSSISCFRGKISFRESGAGARRGYENEGLKELLGEDERAS